MGVTAFTVQEKWTAVEGHNMNVIFPQHISGENSSSHEEGMYSKSWGLWFESHLM